MRVIASFTLSLIMTASALAMPHDSTLVKLAETYIAAYTIAFDSTGLDAIEPSVLAGYVEANAEMGKGLDAVPEAGVDVQAILGYIFARRMLTALEGVYPPDGTHAVRHRFGVMDEIFNAESPTTFNAVLALYKQLSDGQNPKGEEERDRFRQLFESVLLQELEKQ